MALEIERRFLVKLKDLPPLPEGKRIDQGYLSATPEVRIRVVDDTSAVVTIKSDGGMTREEYEYAIPVEDARRMLKLTPWSVVSKTRYKLPLDGLTWEIDQYYGDNDGLWSAEVEVESEDAAAAVKLPPWLALEVTEQRRFNNVSLAQAPFSGWPDAEHFLGLVSS
jgi:adenylate cyclase